MPKAKGEHKTKAWIITPTTQLWVLTITHRHGTDTTLHKTEDGAMTALDEYCQGYWDDFSDGEDPSPDRTLVEQYFEKAEGQEFYDLSTSTIGD